MLHPEAPLAMRVVLAIHISAGTLALIVVPIVMAVRKGGAVHRKLGLWYVYAMGVVALTALVCAPYFGDYFLLLIAIFSSYLTFVGWRTLSRKRPAKQPAQFVDWFGAGLATCAGFGMMAMGFFLRAYFGGFSIVLYVLGAICAGFALRSMYRFLHPPAEQSAWLFEHFGMMLGAYIATVTAFSAVNFHFLHPVWARWLWPTVAGAAVITFYTARYKAKISHGAEIRGTVTV